MLFKKKKLGNELELSYALPESMLRDMPKDTPHVFVNNDRQLVSASLHLGEEWKPREP